MVVVIVISTTIVDVAAGVITDVLIMVIISCVIAVMTLHQLYAMQAYAG